MIIVHVKLFLLLKCSNFLFLKFWMNIKTYHNICVVMLTLRMYANICKTMWRLQSLENRDTQRKKQTSLIENASVCRFIPLFLFLYFFLYFSLHHHLSHQSFLLCLQGSVRNQGTFLHVDIQTECASLFLRNLRKQSTKKQQRPYPFPAPETWILWIFTASTAFNEVASVTKTDLGQHTLL